MTRDEQALVVPAHTGMNYLALAAILLLVA